MKKIILMIALFAISINLVAIPKFNPDEKIAPMKATPVKECATPLFDKMSVKVDNTLQNGTAEVVLEGFVASGYASSELDASYCNQFTYEPSTKYLFAVSCGRYRAVKRDENGDPIKDENGNNIPDSAYGTYKVRRLGELTIAKFEIGKLLTAGVTTLWDETAPNTGIAACSTDVHEWRYPSIAAVNALNSTDFKDVKIGSSSRYITYLPYNGGGVEQYKWFGFTSGQDILDTVAISEYQDIEPWENGVAGYKINGTLKATPAIVDGKPLVWITGEAYNTNDAENTPQNIFFGGANLEKLPTDEGGPLDPADLFKQFQFLPDKIRTEVLGSTILTSANDLYNGMSLDYDSEGNIYFAFLAADPARVIDDEYAGTNWANIRYPVVVKTKYNVDAATVDFNVSTVNRLPNDIIENYLIGQGAYIDIINPNTAWRFGGPFYFNDNCNFSVISPNVYSFVTYVTYHVDADNIKVDLIEVKYDNGTWTVLKIAEPTWGNHYYMNADGTKYIPAEWVVWDTYLSGYRAQMGYWSWDMQMSKTADGQYYVASWKQICDEDKIPLASPFTFYFKNPWTTDTATYTTTIDTFYRNSAMLSYRKIGTDTWSNPVRASHIDTFTFNNIHIPRVVPDIDHIPLAFAHYDQQHSGTLVPTIPVAAGAAQTANIKKIIDNNFYSYGYLSVIIPSAITGPNPIISVEEEGPATTDYVKAYPNPATNNVNFEFSIVNPAQTTLTVQNAIGQTVATIVNQYCSPSTYSVNFNVNNLTTGTYYYTLTSGKLVQTKMFTVVK